MNLLLLLLLWLIPGLSALAEVRVEDARIWTDPEKTRLVLDTGAASTHQIFLLDNPPRAVIDLPNARLVGKLPQADPADPALIGLRSGIQNGRDLRIVADLRQPARIKSFPLAPNERYGHRLVIDFIPIAGPAGATGSSGATGPPTAGPPPIRSAPSPSGQDAGPAGRASARPRDEAEARGRHARASGRELRIAIDAGHGGEDPGAIGRAGTREKDVTLAIARRLARLVDAEPGMRAILIRDGDYFIALRQRIRKAREQQADLFISIHADAYRDEQAHGSSVYTLSNGGASSEAARWLANRENSADLIGGADLGTNDDLLATVLLDMAQSATLEHGTEAAGAILTKLGRVGALHKAEVQRAGFAVLKAPDIPSLLVETAFITNPEEERRLNDERHRERLAEAMLEGIRAYFRKYPPPGAMIAGAPSGDGRQYVVTVGDTLSDVAQRHRVSLPALRAANGLDNDVIRAGQVLLIPNPGGS